jgi:hypothetical protein
MANNFPTIRPSLNMQFAGTGVLPPDVTFTRASSSGGYYDGKTVAKAEENLFVNSVWAGAVSGTPGTVPTNWSFVTSGGSLTVSGESIEFFAAAGQRQSISQNLTVTAGQAITVSVDVDSVVGTASAVVVQLEPLSGTFTSTTNVVVSDGTGRKSASTTCTVGGILRIRFGASVTIATADDCTVSMKAPQMEIRSFATAYTPTTTQPITNYIPKMLFAPANVPVFDHNPTTGEALGLSVWEARTNLLLRSQEFQTTWGATRSTVSVNQLIAPDGTVSADKLIANTDNNTHFVGQNVALVSGTTYTVSSFVKAAEYSQVRLQTTGTANWAQAFFDLTNGTVISNSVGAGAEIRSVGNGWFRISVRGVADLTGSSTISLAPAVAGSAIFTGDGTSGIYIWGAQLEVGAFPTPYIPTVASTVARSADVAVMTGVNFSRWYRADEGAFVVDAFARATPSSSRFALVVSDGTANNRIGMATRAATTTTGLQVVVGGSTVATCAVTVSADAFYKFAGSYAANDFNAAVNGTLATQDTLGGVPVVTSMTIGSNQAGDATTTLNGYIKSLSYYPTRLTNAQLQAVTA